MKESSRKLFAVLLLLLPWPAYAAPAVVLEDWGIYTAETDQAVDQPGSTSGRMQLSTGVRLLTRTDDICAQLGTRFGIRYHLGDDATGPVQVSVDVHHPDLMNTHGLPQNEDVFETRLLPGSTHYSGWMFNAPSELAPGVWRFTVHQGLRILLEKAFDVRTNCTVPSA